MDKILELQNALERANIEVDISGLVNDMKKNEVLAIHKAKITKLNGAKDSRWQTYIINEEGGRKKITSTTEKGLIDKLYNYYKNKEEKITISSLYPIWLEKRREQRLSGKTIHKNMDHWNKYYSNHKIIHKSIDTITADDIEKFFYDCFRDYTVTIKEYGNMKKIITDIFKLAKRNNYISYNPFDEVDVKTVGCAPKTKHKNSERVYLPDEKTKLFDVINKDILNNESTKGYAVFLNFKLGLRIGELSALKWEDIDYDDNTIHIHRMETDEENENEKLTMCVVEYTKAKSEFGDRFLPLSKYELELFNRIKKFNNENGFNSEYIFINENDHNRMTSRQIDNYIRTCCNHASIQQKSNHDIRRTVASEMHANGVHIEIIREFLGHSDTRTTWGYIYNVENEENTKRIIIDSLNSNNGLRTQTYSNDENKKIRKSA